MIQINCLEPNIAEVWVTKSNIMVISSEQHIDNSKEAISNLLTEVRTTIEGINAQTLNTPEDVNKWSMLQCLKHLSFAVEVYNKNVENAFLTGKYNSPADSFKSHWKGDMFTKMISPKDDGTIKPMKTFKSMNPTVVMDAEPTLYEFFTLHQKFADLIEESRSFDLNKVKVNTALGPMVKLRLGDAFRFIIGHAERHLMQLKRIKATVHQVPA